MRIAVVTASGRTGRVVVRHALAAGHEVTAVVRSADRAPEGTSPVESVSTDVGTLTAAFGHADAIVSCLGQVKDQPSPHLLTESARAILGAAQAAGVERVIFVSASGAFIGGEDPLTRYLAKPILNRVLRVSMDDTRAMEAFLRTTDAAWTTIRPSQLVSRAGKGTYRSRIDLSIPWGFQTSYDAVASACLDAIVTPAWIGHAVSVAD